MNMELNNSTALLGSGTLSKIKNHEALERCECAREVRVSFVGFK